MKLTVFLLITASLISAQDAIVVDLSSVDATEVASLYKQKEELESKIKAKQEYVGKKYATWGGSYVPDFTYSTDYKHIVPNNRTFTGSVIISSNVPCYSTSPYLNYGGTTALPLE